MEGKEEMPLSVGAFDFLEEMPMEEVRLWLTSNALGCSISFRRPRESVFLGFASFSIVCDLPSLSLLRLHGIMVQKMVEE